MTGSVLVVGAASPIGGAVMQELSRAGRTATGTSRKADGALTRLDVLDDDSVRGALTTTGAMSIVYLASPADPAADGDAAVDALRRFVHAAVAAGARRIVYTSSASVYGTGSTAPLDEDRAPAPASPYAAMKLESERVLADAAAELPIEAVALRVFNVYGPGLSSSLINRLRGDDPPPVYETGAFVRDYIHVADVARVAVAALDAPIAGRFAVVNAGTGVATDNLALLAMPGAEGRPTAVPAGFGSWSVASTERMRDLLGVPPERLTSLQAWWTDPSRP